MISEKQIIDCDWVTWNGYEYLNFGCDALYNLKNQTLYSHNEVNGDLRKICVVTDIEKFKEICWVTFKIEIE